MSEKSKEIIGSTSSTVGWWFALKILENLDSLLRKVEYPIVIKTYFFVKLGKQCL